MQQVFAYKIEVQGQVDENDLNAMSPLKMSVVRMDSETLQFTIFADQAGLIGVIRYLHGRGFVLLSVLREA